MGRGKKTKADLALFCKDLKGRQLNRRASEENSKYITQNNLITPSSLSEWFNYQYFACNFI